MRTVICQEPGKLELIDRETPEPKAGEVRVSIRRIGICGTDIHAYRGNQPFFEFPRVLGHELSGIREDTGEAVAVIPYLHCGECVPCRAGRTNCCATLSVIGVHEDGGMCESICVPESHVISVADVSLDGLAIVECMAIGAHAVRRSGIGPGDTALVVGTGPIGVGTAQFARIAGAEVKVLDLDEGRLAFCRDVLGIEASAGAEGEAFVFESTGSLAAMKASFAYPGSGGTLVFLSIVRGELSFDDPEFHRREMSILSSRNATRADFEHVVEHIRNGNVEVDRFITHRCELDELPGKFDEWIAPGSGVMKGMVQVGE
jgi:2-desacetyl-2-hydroxyethyl bacteriochlorophyllide A dehydrogenase